MERVKDIKAIKDILEEELITHNSTHEHAPPGHSCLEECGVVDQGNAEVALVRSGVEKHRKCMECWQEFIDKLTQQISALPIEVELERPKDYMTIGEGDVYRSIIQQLASQNVKVIDKEE